MHVVHDGDTLESISVLYQIPVERLQETNHFIPGQPLTTGMVLDLPRETGVVVQSPDEPSTMTP